MLSYLVTGNAPWLELLLVLTVGTTVMVGLAALAERLVRSAIWQRTIWQISTLGVLGLMLIELTGTGPGLVGLWRARAEAEATQPGAAPFEPIPRPLTPGPSPRERGEGRTVLDRQPTAEAQRTAAIATNSGSQPGERVAGVDEHRRGTMRSMVTLVDEPPDPRISGGSLTLDPGHPESDQPLGQASRWLGLIWALGAVLIAARAVCARALLFAFWRRSTRLSDGPLCERAAGLARRLGIRRPISVLEAVGLSAPVAFGSLRPAVALPVTFAEEFDRQQQDAVLAHELAHLAARDPAWQVAAGLLCAALWWHPLVWWSRHRLRAASEAAADEASLLVPGGPDVLAGCLVAMGWRLTRPRQLGWVSFEGPGFRSSLGRRVERLLSLRRRSWRAPGRGRLAFAKATLPVALLIVAVCCTAWARSQATLTEGGTTMSVLRVSWRHSLAAAMLTFVTAGCAEAVADDSPVDQSPPAVAGGDLAGAQVQLALLAEDQEREKGEAREGEKREREVGEAREGKERDREEGEAREGKEPKREKGEAREGKEPKREKGEAREGKEPKREKGEAREGKEPKREKGEAREGEKRPEPRGDLEGQVRELRGQVTELRQQIKELGAILKGLLARERKAGAAREGEKREGKEGAAREDEKRERKEGEAREGENRERKEGDREGKEGKAREDE